MPKRPSKEIDTSYKPRLVVDLRPPPTGNLPAVQKGHDVGRIRDLPMTLDDLMNFGRYDGVKVKDLINSYPRYIFWCIENVDWFWLDKEAYKVWRQRMREVLEEDCLRDTSGVFDVHSDFCDCP